MSDLRLEHIYLRIRQDKFYYLKFILEAYDGLALLSSSGISKDLVIIRYPREMRFTVFALLADLGEKLNPYKDIHQRTN